MPDQRARAASLPVGEIPAEMMGERGDRKRGVGDAPADHHIRAGLKRRQQRIRTQIRVRADDGQPDIAERARLVHEGHVPADQRADVVALDAGDLHAGKPDLTGDRHGRSAAASGLAAPILVMIVVPRSAQTSSTAL